MTVEVKKVHSDGEDKSLHLPSFRIQSGISGRNGTNDVPLLRRDPRVMPRVTKSLKLQHIYTCRHAEFSSASRGRTGTNDVPLLRRDPETSSG